MNTPLHVHTSGSTLDGAIDIDKYIAKGKELGMKALGISDHGSMVKCFEFYKKCKANDIKPIIGCEFYTGEVDCKENNHLILIAMNDVGLKNLYRLTKLSHMNFFKKPRLTLENIQTHSEGLICTSACLGGEFNRLMKQSEEKAIEHALLMKSIFKEYFFLEVQPNSIPDQAVLNKFIQSIVVKHNINWVMTTDAHYINKEDWEAQDTLLCMSMKKKKNDVNRFRFPCKDNYIMTDEEMKNRTTYLDPVFVDVAIRNSSLIAGVCNVDISNDIDLLPQMEEHKDPIFALREACNKGYCKRYEEGHFKGMDIIEVAKRIRYELDVICDKGYAGYFLIVQDFMDWGWRNGVPFGPGRGSVAGSMVAFILGICEANPMKYGLLFERFINPTRDSSPDVDADLDYELRHKVIEYVQCKYGVDNVCQINAEGTMTTKAVIRKVMSVYGYDMSVQNATCKCVNPKANNLKEAMEYPELQYRLLGKPELKDMYVLEGLMSHNSTHAAGVIIAPSRVDNYVPIRIDRESGMMVSEWHKKIVEELKLYKFDFLGLKQVTIFRRTLDDIYKNTGKRISFKELYNINLEDENVYKQINEKSLKYIFQLDGDSASSVIAKMKPDCFNDIMVAESICRPGILEADQYLSNKKDFMDIGEFYKPSYYEHVKHILDESYGCIVYQEQTMQIFHESGNFTLGEADALRKVKSLEPYKKRFKEGWVKKGMTSKEVDDLFARFSLAYSFNKSHACVYGLVTYICAWLKYYYPNEYLANAMTVELLDTDPDINSGIKDCIKNNIKIIPPDINKSTDKFNPDVNGITFPLSMIPFVGDKAYECIVEGRPYVSFTDFYRRVNKTKVNKRVMSNLIKAGSFDFSNKNRSELLKELESQKKAKKGEGTLIPFWCKETLISFERQIYGFSLTTHPLDGYVNKDIADYPNEENININAYVLDVRSIKDRNGNDMCFVKFENKLCTFEGVVFSYNYKQCSVLIQKGAILNITGKKEGNSIKINNVQVA